jgi:hypothetical protein
VPNLHLPYPVTNKVAAMDKRALIEAFFRFLDEDVKAMEHTQP